MATYCIVYLCIVNLNLATTEDTGNLEQPQPTEATHHSAALNTYFLKQITLRHMIMFTNKNGNVPSSFCWPIDHHTLKNSDWFYLFMICDSKSCPRSKDAVCQHFTHFSFLLSTLCILGFDQSVLNTPSPHFILFNFGGLNIYPLPLCGGVAGFLAKYTQLQRRRFPKKYTLIIHQQSRGMQ